MPLPNGRQTDRWIASAARFVGLCIFVAGFFLPAVRAGAPGPDAVVFSGWKCASVALTETVALFGKSNSGVPSLEVLLVAVSGWINPLVLLLLACSFAQSLTILRRILAVLILLCMAATWTFFAIQRVAPLAGHYFWIAGALMILAAEAVGGWPRRAARPAANGL